VKNAPEYALWIRTQGGKSAVGVALACRVPSSGATSDLRLLHASGFSGWEEFYAYERRRNIDFAERATIWDRRGVAR
jgi:hypothetical protein